jgi:hypothetical protein
MVCNLYVLRERYSAALADGIMELRDLRHANSENVVHLIVRQSCADAKLVDIHHASGEFIAVAPHNLLRRRSCSGDLVSKVFGINANNASDIRIRSV